MAEGFRGAENLEFFVVVSTLTLFGSLISLVIQAAGVHPVPSRTRKLSPSALMILGRQRPGKVGHRQRGLAIIAAQQNCWAAFLFL
jgi:hypothetical protein